MQLYNLLHEEFGIDRAHLMLLRHAKGRTAQLLAAGASVHEYTAVQDAGGDYDFKHGSGGNITTFMLRANVAAWTASAR